MLQDILRYLWERRTTVLGYVVTTLGIMATSDLFTPTAIKWMLLINGIITGSLGHYNNRVITHDVASKQGGFIRVMLLAFLLAISVGTALTLSGCGSNSAIQQAETLDQKALATYGSYVIAKEQAAALYADANTPDEIRVALKAANEVVRQPMELMHQAMVAYKRLEEAVVLGTATEAEMQAAAEELLKLYLEAGPALTKFEEAIDKVRK